MDRETPPLRPFRPGDEPPEGGTRHYNPLVIFGIAALAVAAMYVLLMVATRMDDIFFPGNEFNIGVKLPGIDSGENPAYADINQRINILFLGLDLRRDESLDTPGRTDSVFVLTVDPFSKTGGIFSIPRDLLVDIPDGNGGFIQDRVNVAYEIGEYTYEGYPGGGPGLAIDTIEHNFDIPIDNYVILNFQAFIDLIDELGGVEIDVPEYAYDPAYNDCNFCDYYPLEFYPGPEHMDGTRALAYARIRASDNDFKRIERQQLVIRATAKRALDLGILLPDEGLDLYGKYKDAVRTDIPDYKVPGLARLAQQIGPDNIRMVSIAEATYPCYECSASVLLADWEMVARLKAAVFADGRLQAEGAVVEVQNGTEVVGLAEEFVDFFQSRGLAPDYLAASEASDYYDRTLIIDLRGKDYTVEKLAEWLSLPQSSIISASDPRAAPFIGASGDVIVVLGSDAELPTAALSTGGG